MPVVSINSGIKYKDQLEAVTKTLAFLWDSNTL